MQRKLIRQGGGGYTVYLPKKWIDKKALKAGDQIDVQETESSLIISSQKKGKKSITINLTEDDKKHIHDLLTHIYRNGFDSISITNANQKIIERIKQVTKDLLLGFELTKKTSTECKIENISEPTEAKYSTLLRRALLIIKETQEITKKDFSRNKFNFKEIEDLRKQQDKFILFCRRILTKEKYEENLVLEWEFLTFIMHIQHAYYYLYKSAVDYKIKPTQEILKLLTYLEDYFDLYYNAYFKKDIDLVHKILLKRYSHFEEVDKLLATSKKEAILLAHIRNLFRLILIGTSPILSEILKKRL